MKKAIVLFSFLLLACDEVEQESMDRSATCETCEETPVDAEWWCWDVDGFGELAESTQNPETGAWECPAGWVQVWCTEHWEGMGETWHECTI
jgi:hypothetical protein